MPLFGRNSTFFTAILIGAFVGEYAIDQGIEHFYAWHNKGVPNCPS